MPKLWIFNIDEVVLISDPTYQTVFVPKIMEIFPRFFLSISKGDIIISPVSTDKIFLDYVSKVLSLEDNFKWLIRLKSKSEPYSLIDSILNDKSVIDAIKNIENSNFELEGFIETPKLIKLAKKIGIKTNKTDEGLVSEGFVLKLNDKAFFKEIASSLGIRVIEGYVGVELSDITDGIKKISQIHKTQVMLKKSMYGGGFGNLCGSVESLLSKISDFASKCKIVIEPFLNINKVYGSLAIIEDNIRFIGVDEQVFSNGRWVGFDYPSTDDKNIEIIKDGSLKLCDFLFKKGVRGYVNIDWLTTKENPSEPLAIELNLRNNGFNYALDFVRRYSGLSFDNIYLRYRENFNSYNLSFNEIKEKFENSSYSDFFINSAGKKEGFVIMTPPSNGKIALGVFSNSKEKLNYISDKIGVL